MWAGFQSSLTSLVRIPSAKKHFIHVDPETYHHCYNCLGNAKVFPLAGGFWKAVVAIKIYVSWTWTQKALMCSLKC